MAKCLAISFFSFGLQSVTDGGCRRRRYPPHKTFTSGASCGGAGVQLFLNRCFFGLPLERTEWQSGLPRIQDEVRGQRVMPSAFFFSFFETWAPVRSFMWNKVFGKGSQLVRLESLMWWQHGLIFCWAVVKVELGWMNWWGRMKVWVTLTGGNLWAGPEW